MKDHIQKTNAVRLLETAGIPFGLVPYEVDENNLAADHVAAQLGEPIGQVFKTLVLRGDRGGLFVCYIRGGCSPIGMKKPLPTFVHESALLYDHIYVSAGVRGLQIKIEPQALISFIGAEIYPL